MLNFAPLKETTLQKGLRYDEKKLVEYILKIVSNNNKKKKEIYGKKTHDVYCLRLPEFRNSAGTNSRFWCSNLF